MIAIGIVAHHSREGRAYKLADFVEANVVAMDTGGFGAGKNHEACYEWVADLNEPWSVIMEDDAVPVTSFRQQLDQVLRASPTPITSLYLGRSRPPHWQPSIAQVINRDVHFLVGTELLHHVAVAIRTPLIPSMLDHVRADTKYQRRKLPIDEAIGRWARSVSVKVGYARPSIVDHRDDIPTVITRHVSQHSANESGHRKAGEARRAWAYGTRKRWEKTFAVIPEPA